MKRILNVFKRFFLPDRRYALVVGMGMLLGGCEGVEEKIFEGPYHVRFTETEGRVVENQNDPQNQNLSASVEVQAHIVGPQQSGATEISFAVYGDAEENVDYILGFTGFQDKKITIPAGESFGSFSFVPLNNRDRDGDRNIIFEITEVNNGLQIGRSGGGIIGKRVTYTISDDDCLLDLRQFQGTWEVTETIGNPPGEDPLTLTYTMIIEPDFAFNNRVIVRGLAGFTNAQVFLNLDLCQRQIQLPEQRVSGLSGQAGQARSRAAGNFDLEGGTLNLSYTMDRAGNAVRNISAVRQD